jgi:hypothetical protein
MSCALWKICIPRNTRMIYLRVFIVVCPFSIIATPQLATKIRHVLPRPSPRHIFRAKINASYIFHKFIYISSSDKWQYIVKNICEIHKNALLSVLQRHELPLSFWIFISQVPSYSMFWYTGTCPSTVRKEARNAKDGMKLYNTDSRNSTAIIRQWINKINKWINNKQMNE